MVKQVKSFGGLPFFKNDSEECGAMAEAIRVCPPGNVVVWSFTKREGKQWGNVSPAVFLRLIQINRGMYEVISAFPHKVYFDIDKKGAAAAGYLESVKAVIVKYFPGAVMAVSGSVVESKTSYHIVLQNYLIRSEEDRQYVKHTCKHINLTEDDAFDWKVYTTNRNMKCVNQAKPDDVRVQVILENPDVTAHCITCFVGEESLPFVPMTLPVVELVEIEKAQATIDLSTLPKLKLTLPEDLDVDAAEPLQLLSLLPLNESNDHAYTHRAARFAFANGLNFTQFMTWLQGKHGTISDDVKSRWCYHWSRLHAFPGFDMGRMKMVLAVFYPEMKKDLFYRRFAKTFEFDRSLVTKIDTISQAEFKLPEKYCIFNVGMGGGKTAQTVSYLRPNDKSFCWIAPNTALAHNTIDRLETNRVKCDYYQRFCAVQKSAGCLNECASMVICANSLHYIAKDKEYDVVVIDEIETLIDKWFGPFMQHKASNWRSFVHIVRSAKKVILLDAFITTKTLNLLRELEGGALEGKVRIFERIIEKTNRTVNYVSSVPLMHQNILDDLEKGLKLFIFYPMKKKSKTNADAVAMRTLFDMISEKTGKKGIYYNADVDEDKKKGLKNVNEAWGDNQFIITNTMITCGVNYDREDFDKEYLFIASFNSPRDIIQVSYRPRHITSGLINVCYLSKVCQQNAWEVDTKDIDCPIYSKMIDGILTEKKTPLKKTFQLFCTKAHYGQQTDTRKMSEALEKEIREMIGKYDMSYSYADIKDITYLEAAGIEAAVFDGTATMDEKVQLQKYFFREKFSEEGADVVYRDPLWNFKEFPVLEYAWDNQYLGMIAQMERLFQKPDNVFAKIKEANGLDCLFPSNMKKLKLTPAIIEQIFVDFKFKYLTEKSAVTKLVQEIYNSYYGLAIIAVETDANRHATYTCDSTKWAFFDDYVTKYSKRRVSMDAACLFEVEGDDMVDIA